MNMSTRERMKAYVVAFLLLIVVFTVAQSQSGETAATGSSSQAMSARYEDLTWQTMVPELGTIHRRSRFCELIPRLRRRNC